ncbi:MAG: YggT family protein [Tenericutes bacterium]|nr:YggT family protein [Mycoplasmatota bacterium]
MEILVQVLYQIVQVYFYTMFVFILLSWTPLVNSEFYRLLGRICNPYLNIFRGKLVISNMDFGGLVGIILLQVVMTLLRNLL